MLSLVRTDPRRAEAALEDLADLFRVLMRDNRELAPLADEVELCRQYLDLEKLRLGERLTIDWHIDNMPGDALVPPLVLQPLLENAVYHGIEPSSAPGVVSDQHLLKRAARCTRSCAIRTSRRRRPPRRQQDGARQHARAPGAAFRRRGELDRACEDSYEVHIRMPYRTAAGPAGVRRRGPTRERAAIRTRRREARTLPDTEVAHG